MSTIKRQIKYAKGRIGTLSREIFYSEHVKRDTTDKQAELNKWLDQLNKLRKIVDVPIVYGKIQKWKKDFNRFERKLRHIEANAIRECIIDGAIMEYNFCVPHRHISDQLESEVNYLGHGKIYAINGKLQNQRFIEPHHFFTYKDNKRKHLLKKQSAK